MQYESLHRMDLNQAFDLVVLDESESIFAQADSKVAKEVRQTESLYALSHIVANCHYLICQDAALSDRTWNCANAMRRDPNPLVIINEK